MKLLLRYPIPWDTVQFCTPKLTLHPNGDFDKLDFTNDSDVEVESNVCRKGPVQCSSAEYSQAYLSWENSQPYDRNLLAKKLY